MKRARFIAAARPGFLAEIVYYNDAQQGLGERFAAAVEKRRLAPSPFLSPVRHLARGPVE